MATGKQLKGTILARRAAKGPRKKRTRPKPRQYTIADLERARDRVAAAERRIDNDRTNNPNRGRAVSCALARNVRRRLVQVAMSGYCELRRTRGVRLRVRRVHVAFPTVKNTPWPPNGPPMRCGPMMGKRKKESRTLSDV
jgi:hypothetical protein